MAKVLEKKKFYPIQVPLLNKEIELYGRQGSFEGKHVKLDLTNSLKGKGLEIKFVVEDVDGKLITTPKQAYLQGFYIRRMLRKGTDYVEDSFLIQCKDHRLRVKPFMITRKRVSKIVLKGLREKAKEEISKYVKDKSFDIIVKDVMEGTLQKQILPALKKIYPLGLCEVRFIGIEDLKEHEKYEEEQAEQAEEAEVEEIKEEVKPEVKEEEIKESSDSTDNNKEKIEEKEK